MSSDRVHRFVIAYDVASDARRIKVARTLESYGDRLQYSVFLVDVKPAKLLRLRLAVHQHLDLHCDSVLFCDLGPLTAGANNHIQFVGTTRSFTGHGPLVF